MVGQWNTKMTFNVLISLNQIPHTGSMISQSNYMKEKNLVIKNCIIFVLNLKTTGKYMIKNIRKYIIKNKIQKNVG